LKAELDEEKNRKFENFKIELKKDVGTNRFSEYDLINLRAYLVEDIE
jgi:hypothetical protein